VSWPCLNPRKDMLAFFRKCGSACRSASVCFGAAQGQSGRGPTSGSGGNTSNCNNKKNGGRGGVGWLQQQGGWQQQQGGQRVPP
jgi:hypothetical protein